jgi:hypothetical protein
MLSEIITGYYDIEGKKVSKLSTHVTKYFKPTFPMERYMRQPLKVNCSSFEEIRNFLKKCRYISDEIQFNLVDYWMPPEDFEDKKQGDCEDFALWTWRQLLGIGHDARFVVGRARKHGDGHAWVTYTESDKGYLCEPLAAWFCKRLPRLSFVRYEPYFSVGWDGNKIYYYAHKNESFSPTIFELSKLVLEWAVFWIKYMPLMLGKGIKYQYLRTKFILKQIFSESDEPNSIDT